MTPHDTSPARLPASDVSPWVGLVGLVTLISCIAVAREWPALADIFGFDPSRGRLSGPNAALLTMAVTGLTMAAWSVMVEKVHLSPSTQIDWVNKRPVARALETATTKLAGLWTTWIVIGLFYALGRWYWGGQYLFAMRVIGMAAVPIFILSVPYVIWLDRVMKQPRDQTWHFGAMLIGRESWDGEQVKKHWRAWIIKGFFAAFMISILPPGFASVVNADFGAVLSDPVRLAVLLFKVLFVIDVQIGTVGYLLTLRPLDAHIRSGNPFLAGWIAALICYPPFISGLVGDGGIIEYTFNTRGWGHWLAGYPILLWLWAIWLVFLTAIYAWATMAFGIRFSNLTYRGVLTNGPYRFTRHPAYLSKNVFWWFSILPFLVTSDSTLDAVRNTCFLALVSAIYYWRARTEEAHLLAEDPKYRDYYAWMDKHGFVTAPLARLLKRANPRKRDTVQPAQ